MNNLFIKQLKQKVLLADGAMGSILQSHDLDITHGFEILNLTKPDIIEKIHRSYLEVGADCIETNTFGASEAKTYEINLAGAKLARNVVDEFATATWPRFVIGDIGPGIKFPSLEQITHEELVESYYEQARGLLDGKVDLLLLETVQDLLTIKACVQGCRQAQQKCNANTPIFVQVTLGPTGKTLFGTDIATIVTTLIEMDVDGMGLNCGVGPAEMAEPISYISKNWSKFISVMPNAGLPKLVEGKTQYQLTPDELAKWQQRFVEQNNVNLIGGCCGTTPAHIAALRKMLDKDAL